MTNSTQYFAIDTTSGASKPVLIATSADETDYVRTSPLLEKINADYGFQTTDGYYIYGTQITWLTSSRVMESNFYAVASDTTGIWELYWDADSSAGTEGTVVVLKAIAPPSVGKASTSTSDDDSS